jgi:hypothetical protein
LTLDDTMTAFEHVTPVDGRRDIRYGAAVYGSFLVASVVGAAFEAGADARSLTGSAFVSMLVFWFAHVWSEVVGEHVAAGSRFRLGSYL